MALITCDAYPGDPPQQQVWIRNGTTLGHQNPLVIPNITTDNAGIYTCTFEPSFTQAFDIYVNVISRPMDRLSLLLQSVQTVPFGNPLNLTCLTDQEVISSSWIVAGVERTSNTELYLQPEEVFTGIYTCVVLPQGGNDIIFFPIFVRVTHIPPTLEEPREISVITVEGNPHYMTTNFQHQQDSASQYIFEWKKSIGNSLGSVDFFPRFSYTVSETNLAMKIDSSKIEDEGVYQLNISNADGYDILTVQLFVIQLKRSHLRVTFIDISCTLVKVC